MEQNHALITKNVKSIIEFGHIVGDKVLAHIAHKLKEIGGDVVRYRRG